MLDPFLDPLVGLLVDHRADRDPRRFRIAHAQTGRGGNEPIHDAIVVFFEHDQTRAGGAFLTLITKGRINRIDDRFVEIGIGIDDDPVLSAHFANDALEFALTRAGFAGRFPNSQTHFREPVKAIISTSGMIDQMRAND